MCLVTSVRPLDDYKLDVVFDDGTQGEVDLKDRLFGPVFEPLRDFALFRQVSVDEFGAICWPNGADLAPDALHERIRRRAGHRIGHNNDRAVQHSVTMDPDRPPSPDTSPNSRPFQFSLATTFVFTAAFSILFGAVFTLPDGWSGFIILSLIVALPPALVVAMKYGTGNFPAFCIGAFVPAGMCFALLILDRRWETVYGLLRSQRNVTPTDTFLSWFLVMANFGVNWRPMAVISWAAAIMIGFICVGVRRWVQRGER